MLLKPGISACLPFMHNMSLIILASLYCNKNGNNMSDERVMAGSQAVASIPIRGGRKLCSKGEKVNRYIFHHTFYIFFTQSRFIFYTFKTFLDSDSIHDDW